VKRAAPKDQKVHEKLDPKGVKFREARDSLAHPESLPIMVMLDVTGSMQNSPRVIQAALPKLMGSITTLGGTQHPQILFGAIGDSRSDRGSLQVGQFESGIEMDDDLGRFWLEGGGGGSGEESYQNAIYFAARHTVTDHWEKRQKKGYLFMIGDELPYPQVSASEIMTLCDKSLEGVNIPTEQIVKEAQERYNVFFIIPRHADHGSDPRLRQRWSDLLGEDHVILMDREDLISETIALAIGLCEGNVNLESEKVDASVALSLRTLAASLGKKIPTPKTVRL